MALIHWLRLTDRYGAPVRILKNTVLAVYGDSCSEGDGQRTVTICGTTIVTANGAAMFATQGPDEVFDQLDEVPAWNDDVQLADDDDDDDE